MLDAFPATTLPLYPGLGQAPNMLDCIPSGMVSVFTMHWVTICLLKPSFKLGFKPNFGLKPN